VLIPHAVLVAFWPTLGSASLVFGRIDEAVAQLRKALNLRPDYEAAATMLRIPEEQRSQ